MICGYLLCWCPCTRLTHSLSADIVFAPHVRNCPLQWFYLKCSFIWSSGWCCVVRRSGSFIQMNCIHYSCSQRALLSTVNSMPLISVWVYAWLFIPLNVYFDVGHYDLVIQWLTKTKNKIHTFIFHIAFSLFLFVSFIHSCMVNEKPIQCAQKHMRTINGLVIGNFKLYKK